MAYMALDADQVMRTRTRGSPSRPRFRPRDRIRWCRLIRHSRDHGLQTGRAIRVGLMNSAKSLRKRALTALKIVDDLDDTDIDEGASPSELTHNKLREATSNIQGVEQTARMLIGRVLGDDVGLAALKRRLRQEILSELLDVVNSFVDPNTYQKIRRQLARAG